jgi:hypothetical protein
MSCLRIDVAILPRLSVSGELFFGVGGGLEFVDAENVLVLSAFSPVVHFERNKQMNVAARILLHCVVAVSEMESICRSSLAG